MLNRFSFLKKSKWSFLVLAFTISFSGYQYIKYYHLYTISWDVYGYYLYLPQAFINHDLGMENQEDFELIGEVYPIGGNFYQRAWSDAGYWVIKYPIGMSYLYLPAFITGQTIACLTDNYVDGYSPPYERSLWVLCLISVVTGLIMLRKILLKLFGDLTSALVLFFIYFGTNYIATTSISAAMPHNFLFTLFALNVWFTIKWWETNRIKYAVFLGIVLGISIAARFTSAIGILIPVFWGTDFTLKAVRNRIVVLFTEKLTHTLVALLIIVLLFFPQMLYWKTYAGSWIYDSYANPGEGLDLLSPYTFSFLFSYKKGWLVYTPIIIFAILGLIYIWKNNRTLFLPVLSFFCINLWVLSSWTTWWYAQSFSQRPMVDSLPLTAIMLGFFIDNFSKRKRWVFYSVNLLLLLITCFTLFQFWQFTRGIIHGSRMNKNYYWAVFGATEHHPELNDLLSAERNIDEEKQIKDESRYNRKYLCNYAFNDFDEYYDVNCFDSTRFVSPGRSFRLDSLCQMSPNFSLPSSAILKGDHVWVKTTLWIYPEDMEAVNSVWVINTLHHDHKCYNYEASQKECSRMIPGQWNFITVYYLITNTRSPDDTFMIYLWSSQGKKVWLDDMKVFAYTPKEIMSDN